MGGQSSFCWVIGLLNLKPRLPLGTDAMRLASFRSPASDRPPHESRSKTGAPATTLYLNQLLRVGGMTLAEGGEFLGIKLSGRSGVEENWRC